MTTGNLLSKGGAIAYCAWAVLHFVSALAVFRLGEAMPEGMAQARVLQDAWNLGWFSVLAVGVAVALNWRNDVRGWWLNLAIVSVADLGLILFVLAPGTMPLWPGVVGPVLWLSGLALSTAALPRGSIVRTR